MLQKLGSLWVALDKITVYDRATYSSLTVWLANGQAIVLDGEERVAFLEALEKAVSDSRFWRGYETRQAAE